MPGYLDEFKEKWRSKVSPVFVVETVDPVRLRLFTEFANNIFGNAVYFYDIQLNKLMHTKVTNPLAENPTPAHVVDKLKEFQCCVIARYVYRREDAMVVEPTMMAAIQESDDIFRKKSALVVFTSDSNLFSPPVLRLSAVITVPVSTPEERRQLLEFWAEQLNNNYFKSEVIKVPDDVVRESAGLTLYDVETAALESATKYKAFKPEVFVEYKVRILRSAGLSYIKPTRGFETVGGYRYLKDYIRNRILRLLKNPELAKLYGLRIPKGMLLYGPPGTGKTWFAKAIAAELGLPMVQLEANNIFRAYVGESESRMKYIAGLVESLAPVVVFIDEFEQLGIRRDRVADNTGVTERIINLLLVWLGDENRQAFVIAATNNIDMIDPAFLRPGRLDEIVPVLYPDYEARREILRVHTSVIRKMPLADDVDLDEVARRTVLWTGAELEKLVLESGYIAMERGSPTVRMEHFEEALWRLEINTRERLRVLEEIEAKLSRLEAVNRGILRMSLEVLRKELNGGKP